MHVTVWYFRVDTGDALRLLAVQTDNQPAAERLIQQLYPEYVGKPVTHVATQEITL